MKFFALTTMTVFLFGLAAAGQLLGAGQQESGKYDSGAAQMEQSEQQRAADMERDQSEPGTGAARQELGQQQVSAQRLSSEQVREVQQSLQEKGVDPGPVDGIMGPKTRAAIKEFQQQEGITATGQPNQQTLEALDVEFMGVSPAFEEKEQMQEQRQDEMKELEQMQKQTKPGY